MAREQLTVRALARYAARNENFVLVATSRITGWCFEEVIMADTRSPRIAHLSWGKVDVEIDGGLHHFKDVKLFPGGAREWDWRETGTDHVPGIQSADVNELLEHGAKVIVLSKGQHERLQVSLDTLEFLRGRQIPTHVLETNEAVRLYNELREQQPTGGLFHSTC